MKRLQEKFEPYHTGEIVWVNDEQIDYNLSLPPWICQQYIRMAPEKHIEFLAQRNREAAERDKIDYFDDAGNKISKNVLKRLKKAERKSQARVSRQKAIRQMELCCTTKCANPTVQDIIQIKK